MATIPLARLPIAPEASRSVAKKVAPLLAGPLFAVILCGNMQYKVACNDVIAVQRLRAEIGQHIALKKILVVGGEQFTAIGRPFLEHCRVVADVEEQKQMQDVISLFAPKGRRLLRWVDHRHCATILRIRKIEYAPEIIAEVNKYDGKLVTVDHNKYSLSNPTNRSYWCDVPEGEPAMKGTYSESSDSPAAAH